MVKRAKKIHLSWFKFFYASQKSFWRMAWLGSLVLTPSSLHALPLDWETLVDLEQVVHEVVTRYPVQQFVMIGIGRSPAPLIAWLQELNPGAGFSVSASGLGIEELANPNERVALLSPQLERLRGDARARVAVDFVSRGTSLAVGSVLLARADPGRREQAIDLSPHWQALGLIEVGRTWAIDGLGPMIVREVQAAGIQVSTVGTSPHLEGVFARERLKFFSEVGRQELGLLAVAPAGAENNADSLEVRSGLFRFAIRSYQATRARATLSEGEWRALLQDLQRREALSPARREEVAHLVFWAFHSWASHPSRSGRPLGLPASLGAQHADLLLVLLQNPEWQVSSMNDPQSLLGIVMDRAGQQLRQAPNGEFSRRLTALFTQGTESSHPVTDPHRLLENGIRAGAKLRAVFPRESGYRSWEMELLSQVSQLLRRRPGFSPTNLLEREIIRDWILESPSGPVFFREWMVQAGPNAWLRWLGEAQSERQRWCMAHFIEDEIQQGNLTSDQREALRVGLRGVQSCDAAMLRRIALYLRE